MCGLKQSSEPLSQNNKRLCSNKLKNGFENTQVFADDGYSGVNFERPAFRRMLHLIEDEKIGVIITKDLSRLGRNYIEVGSYTEIYFPKNNVRYIAVNEFLCSLLRTFKNFIHRSGYITVLPVIKCCCYSDFHSVTTFLNWSKLMYLVLLRQVTGKLSNAVNKPFFLLLGYSWQVKDTTKPPFLRSG